MYDGILLIDKPLHWTSFDVVAKVRSILSKEFQQENGQKKKIKVGHTGTLDPLASGLMIVVVGSYCKRAAEFSKLDKSYQVQIKLGENSSTGDEEGKKTAISSKVPSLVEVHAVTDSFIGEIMQTPPAFSAIKINGQKAYDLARKGQKVKLEPRKVIIYDINNLVYNYPSLDFDVKVSSGSYIRSLAEDIGKNLGTGGYITSLRRTIVGEFDIKDAITVESVSSTAVKADQVKLDLDIDK